MTDSHRGGFGEFGGEAGGLIDRAFRERIVLVGVTRPPDSEEDTERFLTDYLEAAGGRVERSTRLLSMTQDADYLTNGSYPHHPGQGVGYAYTPSDPNHHYDYCTQNFRR